jgi:hypothetical protein
MGIEFSGLLHTSYVIQHIVAQLAGKPMESNEPPRTVTMKAFFYGRCIMSIVILIFAFAVTLTALFQGKSNMWDSVPPVVSVIIFAVLLCVVGLLEGSQIAYFAVAKLQKSERGSSIWALKTCEILFKNNNHNLAAFMIGRQLCVVSCMFFIARITSVDIEDGEDNIFGVSDSIQAIFDTGVLGAICVAIVGSISWRLIASAFPIPFLANPITYILLRFCLLLEMSGVLHGAYVLAAIHKKIAGFQRDEVYIGTAEERAAKKLGDDANVLQGGPGHPIPELDVGENPVDSMNEEEKAPKQLENDTETQTDSV